MTEPPQTAERRQHDSTIRWRGCPLDIAYVVPPAVAATTTRSTSWPTILASGRSSRLNRCWSGRSSSPRPPESSWTRVAVRACSRSSRTVRAGQEAADSKRPSTRKSRRSRRPGRRLGNGEGAQQRRAATPPAACCSSLQRAIELGAGRAVLQRSQPHQHEHGTDPEVTAADVQRVAKRST